MAPGRAMMSSLLDFGARCRQVSPLRSRFPSHARRSTPLSFVCSEPPPSVWRCPHAEAPSVRAIQVDLTSSTPARAEADKAAAEQAAKAEQAVKPARADKAAVALLGRASSPRGRPRASAPTVSTKSRHQGPDRARRGRDLRDVLALHAQLLQHELARLDEPGRRALQLPRIELRRRRLRRDGPGEDASRAFRRGPVRRNAARGHQHAGARPTRDSTLSSC